MIQYIPFPGDYYSLVIKNKRYKKYFSPCIENKFEKEKLIVNSRKKIIGLAELAIDDPEYLKYLRLDNKYFIGFWFSNQEILEEILGIMREFWVAIIFLDDLFGSIKNENLKSVKSNFKNLFFIPISKIMEIFEFKLFSAHLLFSFWEVAKTFNIAKNYCGDNNLFLIKEDQVSRITHIPFITPPKPGKKSTRFILNKNFNYYVINNLILDDYNEKINMGYDNYSDAVHFFNRMFTEKDIFIPGFEVFDMFLRTFIFEMMVYDISLEFRLNVNDKFIKSFFGMLPPAYGLIDPDFQPEDVILK